MPIQLLLDWRKALVAIVSLLLAISFIMCKPIVIGQSDDFHHENRSQSLKQNAIESVNEIQLNASSMVLMMPLNNTLSHNPFGSNSTKTDTLAANVNATQTTDQNPENVLKNHHHRSLSTATKVNTANHTVNATHELNLAAINEDDQLDKFKRQLKSFARTKTNINSTDQIVDTTKTPHTLNVQNETQTQTTTTKLNVLKMVGKKFTHTTEVAVKLPVMQTTHQSTITTKATIQSVFLDYSNNFNGTKSQQKRADQINHNDFNVRDTNQSQTMTMAMANDEILSRTERSVQNASNKRRKLHNDSSNAERIERSANFSLTRASKRIQLLLKGRFLQMLRDGSVNGTQDEQSEYTILQRNTVDVGQIRLIGIATCLYLCMDSCGNLYSSREFTNDCIFNERLENNYNYYTSTHHSSALRTYYMALSRLGTPRKTHLPSNKPLGKLSTYVRAFTLTVPEQRSDAVIGKRFGFNHVKHGMKHLCESGKQLMELTTKQLVYPECNSGSSSSSISIDSSSNVGGGGGSSSMASKKQPNHHIRHANANHQRRVAPAQTERGSNANFKNSGTDVIAKGVDCETEQCAKRKKQNHNGNRGSSGKFSKKNVKKSNHKHIKGGRTNSKKMLTTPLTTTTTTTSTTTENVILYSPSAGHDRNVPVNYDDDLDYPSGTVQIAANSQSGLVSDEDYESDK